MTIARLIKKLEAIAKKHGPRTPICIDLKELKDVCERHEKYSHWEANCLDVECINWYIDDNCELADGSERQRIVAVIS